MTAVLASRRGAGALPWALAWALGAAALPAEGARGAADSSAPLRAGFAALDITPPAGWRLYGSFQELFATGVHDPLLVKALVLEQGNERAALVVCDLCCVPRAFTEPARREASRRTGIPAANIVICATHTHGGPDYEGVLRDARHEREVRGKGRDEHEPLDYLPFVVERAAGAVAAAAAAARPVRLEALTARAPGLAFNRRYHMRDGTVRFNPGRRNPDIVRPAGPVDSDVPFFLWREAESGRPLGSLAVFAMHVATFGDGRFGADYPMHLEGRLREALGPDLVSVFGQGTAGDVNHIDVGVDEPRTGDGEPTRIGSALAAAILAKLPEAAPVPPLLAVRSATVLAPLAEITPEDIERARGVVARMDTEPLDFLLVVHAWKVLNTERLRRRFGAQLPLEVNAIRLGAEAAVVLLPHEVFVEIGLAIRRASPFRQTAVITMAHDLDFYVPTRKAFAEGGYEVVTSSVKPGAGEMLVEAALGLLGELDPAGASPSAARQAATRPLSPDEALASFRLEGGRSGEKGLRLELVAAEPLVDDPVALAWDERGRLFVAENRGYPLGPGEGKPPAGKIALLEDTDGDGRPDRRAEFAGGLTFPNGLLPWKGGLFVTCAPDLLYLGDADGDGRAEERRVVLTGFATRGSTQLRVSHPTLGPDGWIYLTSGLTGGKIACPGHPERPPLESSADVRFHPESLIVESAGGGGQFGQAFDDFGRRFTCMNRVQVQHVVLEPRALARNPNLAFAETMENCPELVANPLLRGGGGAARLYPLSSNLTTADSHAGTFSAACAVTIYRGTALPEEYRGGAFSCDPTGNLVHFDRLEPRGATFGARRARDGVEFLASTDDWFRPVFLANGPDGALHVCDMYRRTIEHPEYLPEEVRRRTDFASGRGLGRIYRVTGSGGQGSGGAAKGTAHLGAASTEELAALLLDPEGWRRDTAFRLLVERRDGRAGPALAAALARAPAAAAAAAVLRAMDSLGALPDAALAGGLRSAEAPLREVAVALAAPRLGRSPELAEAAVRAAADPDPRVRFACALAFGELKTPAAAAALGVIGAAGAADRWTRAAILGSAAGREWEVLEALLEQSRGADRGPSLLLGELGRVLGRAAPTAGTSAWLRRLAAAAGAATGDGRLALLGGFADGARDRGLELGPARDELREAFDEAARLVVDGRPGAEARERAAALLAHAPHEVAGPPLLALVDSREPAGLRAAAIRALGRLPDRRVAAELLSPERWQSYPPALREAALAALLARAEHLPGVLEAVRAGALPAAAVDANRRRRLTEHQDGAIRSAARELFKTTVPGDRRKVFEEWKAVLAIAPDAAAGRAVFRRACSSCHRLDREGAAVGPDLFDIRNQSKESILLHVIAPDEEVLPAFAAYAVQTRDGRSLTGIIAGETETAVTLRQAGGLEESVLRADVAAMAAQGLSLMPQELEKTMTQQEMADLLAYLKGEE